MSDPQVAARPLKPDLAHSLAWRLIAELMRRHQATSKLCVYSIFPGLSPWGELRVASLDNFWDAVILGKAAHLVFGIGGPRPGYFDVIPFADPRLAKESASWPDRNWAWALLTESDPKTVVDELEALAGLPAVEKPSPTTPPILVARVIAELLGRRALGRTRWRASCSLIDHDGSVPLAAWAEAQPWLKEQLQGCEHRELLRQGSRFWLVHQLPGNAGPAQELTDLPGRALAFDFKTGRAWDAAPGGRLFDLPQRYKDHARKLSPVVAELEQFLDTD